MYNGDVGSVGGSDNTQWNRKLAEELDAADGKKDGKISADKWNGFLNSIHSNGNKIKNFINIDNAAKSFAYYDKKKDVGKVDYSDWKNLLNVYLGKSEDKDAVHEEHQPNPEINPDTKEELTEQQKAEFKQNSPLKDIKNAGDVKKLDLSKFEQVAINGQGTEILENKQTGERIHITRAFDGGPDGGYTTLGISYEKDGIIQDITFDASGNVTSDEVKKAPVTPPAPDPDSDAGKVQQEQKEMNEALQKSPLSDLKTLEDFSKMDKSKFPLVEDRGANSSRFVNTETGEDILLETDESGKNATITYTSDGIKHTVKFVDGKFSEGKIEAKQADGSVKAYDYTMAEDGTKILGVKNKDNPPVTEPTNIEQQELAAQVDNLPYGKDKMPTEDDLLKAGFKKNETMMTSNGGILYENPETGESIILTPSHKTLDYSKGNVRITQFYGDDGKPTGGAISIKGEQGAFAVGKFELNPETGKMETALTESHRAINHPIEKAKEGMNAHYDKIADFAKQLGIPEGIIPRLNEMSINNTTGAGFAERTSVDGNYKAKLEMDKNGNVVITYLQKQADGSFNEIGEVKLDITTATSSLRGYDYMCSMNNHITGSHEAYSGAAWT